MHRSRVTVLAVAGIVLLLIGVCTPATVIYTAYQTVLNAGSALPAQSAVNFTGSGVSCADNSGSSRTDCTVTTANITSGPFASIPATCTHTATVSDLYFFNDSLLTHAVCTATNTFTYYAAGAGVPVTPPPSAGWTWDNQGASTISFTNGQALMTAAFLGGVQQIRVQYRTAPATPYTITTRLTGDLSGGGYAGTFTAALGGAGLAFSDSTGKYVVFYFLDAFSVSPGAAQLGTYKFNSATSIFNAAYNAIGNNAGGIMGASKQYMFQQISDDGANLTFRFSVDGKNWQTFDQRLRTDFLLSGPTRVAWFSFVPSDAASNFALMDWTVTTP